MLADLSDDDLKKRIAELRAEWAKKREARVVALREESEVRILVEGAEYEWQKRHP